MNILIWGTDSWEAAIWKLTILVSNDTTKCHTLPRYLTRHDENSIFGVDCEVSQFSTDLFLLHAHMLYPVAIYTVSLLDQRLQITLVPRVHWSRAIPQAVHPIGLRYCFWPLVPCTAPVTNVVWSFSSTDLGLACLM